MLFCECREERLFTYLLISCMELEIQPEAQRVRVCRAGMAHLEPFCGGELGLPGGMSVVKVVGCVCRGGDTISESPRSRWVLRSVCPRMKAGRRPGLPALPCEPPRVQTPPRHLGGIRADGCCPARLQEKRCPATLSSVPPGDAASWSAGGPVVGGVTRPVCRGAGRCLWSR